MSARRKRRHAVSTTHYPAATGAQTIETHTLAVIVDNEPGVLARVIGLFSGRGYNIDSLTVSETEHEKHLSRITIVTRGTPMVIEQIKNQLERLVPIHRVVDLTQAGPSIQRELAMVKVRGTGDTRLEALRVAEAFRARTIDAGTESFIFEITGSSDKIEQFIALMLPLGLVEVSRTGVVAIGRGPEGVEPWSIWAQACRFCCSAFSCANSPSTALAPVGCSTRWAGSVLPKGRRSRRSSRSAALALARCSAASPAARRRPPGARPSACGSRRNRRPDR